MAFNVTAADEVFGKILADIADQEITANSETQAFNRVSMRAIDLQMLSSEIREEYLMTVATQVSAWVTAPVRGDTCTIDSVTYRILMAENSPDGVDLRLHLGPEFSRG